MEATRITSKGQITLPVKVRKAMHLSAGDSVYFEKRGNDYILKPYTNNFEDIRATAEKLGLESMADVEQLLNKLSVGYEQSKNGQTITADEFFRELLDIRAELGELSEQLGLKSLEDVADLVKELHSSYIQAHDGKLSDKSATLSNLRARYNA